MSKLYKVFIIGNDEINNMWVNDVIYEIKEYPDKKVSFVYTNVYFDKPYTNETRLWELNQIQDSDIVIVNLDDIANNISAHCMLASVQMMNKARNKHTFVIGIGNPNTDNIWLLSCIFKQFANIEDAAEYITDKIII